MKSVFGLNENIAGALSYLFGPFTDIVVLILERENKFVRFHALQSTLWFLFLLIAGWVLGFVLNLFGSIPLLGFGLGLIINPIVWIGSVLYIVSKIFLVIKAFQGATFKLPVIGDVVWAQVNG